jgi:hypothetical protein
MTSQGSPYAIFRRAIESGNVMIAEVEARQIQRMTLSDALDLTALVALRDPKRGSRYAARWLARWVTEVPSPTLEDAAIVVAYLGALGGPRHDQVVVSLRAIVQRG